MSQHVHDREATTRLKDPGPPVSQEETAPERVASAAGNQAFGVLAREGSGILPDGTAHPDVERTIATMKGGGHSLPEGINDRMSDQLGDDLSDVRVHTGGEADGLARSVQAKAFATGPDIFFAEGQYRPETQDGERLIGHELTHVTQQRGAPESGPLAVSQPGDAMEREADEAARDLAS